MSNLKYILMALLTVSFALLTACNDGFKSAAVEDGDKLSRIDRDEENLDKGVTPEEEDRAAVSDLDAILRIANSSYSDELELEVEAFSIVRNDKFDDFGINSMSMTAIMLTGCDPGEEFKVTGAINVEDLFAKKVVSIGSKGDYEFLVRCTDDICDEMVATIYKKVTNGEYGRVDFGMMGYQTSGSFSTRVVEYASRNNPGRGLLFVRTVGNHKKYQCSDDLDGLWSDPPSIWDNSINIDHYGAQ